MKFVMKITHLWRTVKCITNPAFCIRQIEITRLTLNRKIEQTRKERRY